MPQENVTNNKKFIRVMEENSKYSPKSSELCYAPKLSLSENFKGDIELQVCLS